MKSLIANLFFTLFLFFISFTSEAFESKVDSLRCLIEEEKDAVVKVDLLNELSRFIFFADPDESYNVAKKAFFIAKLNNYDAGMGFACNLFGTYYFHKNNYSETLENYFYACKYLKDTGNDRKLAKVYTNLALTFVVLKIPTECIKFSQLSLEILKNIRDDDLVCDNYFCLATSYNLLGNHEKQIKYLNEAIDLRNKNKQWIGLGKEYNSLGVAYWDRKEYDKALYNFNFYLKLSIQHKDSIGISRGYINIGETLNKKEEYLKAIKAFEEAIKLKQFNIADAHLGAVQSYSKINCLFKATLNFNTALKEKPELKPLIDACKVLAESYAKSSKKDKSIYYYNLLYTLKDSLHKSSIRDIEENSKIKYEIQEMEERMKEKADLELQKEKQTNQLLKANLSLQNKFNYSLGAAVALLVLVISAIVVNYRKNRIIHQMKTKELERESLFFQYESIKNQVSPHFLFNCLNVLVGLLYESPEKSAKFVGKLAEVYRYVLKNKNKELVDLDTELEFIDAFVYLLKIKFSDNIQIYIDLPATTDISIPPLTLQMLIENCIKHNTFSKEKPLQIEVFMQDDFIVVTNNIQQKDVNDEKSGIGLENLRQRFAYLTEKQVQVENNGQTFVIKVPQL